MRKYLFIIALGVLTSLNLQAADTVRIKELNIPILIEREDNQLFYIRIDAKESKEINKVVLNLGNQTNLSEIKSVKLYYSGTEAVERSGRVHFAPVAYISREMPGMTRKANASYSIEIGKINKPKQHQLVFNTKHPLFAGINYLWVSVEMKKNTSLLSKLTADITEVQLDGKKAPIANEPVKTKVHRMAYGVRHAGDDNAAAYRIPGLVTSNKGSLLAVYDVRYNNSVDLQERVDVGLSRSTDKGQTWEPMRIIMTFGEDAGLPSGQNGVGDPAILVDTKTGTIWTIAAWTHGMGNYRAWFNSQQGMDKNHTAQLVLTKSTDDGKTWSAPINITDQVKKPEWYFLLQGPGMGITMADGTLVFPIQYIDEKKVPNAGVMYSKDGGETWHIHNHARTNTTEAQVAEVEPGVLMLNMRDNRGGSRAVSITRDLGKTWEEHSSNRSALQESVCMASLIKVDAKDNALNKDILLFSNPNTTKGRHSITIKASLDGGKTWLPEHEVLLDAGHGWGYSCLTMVDKNTVGIIYEGSQAHMIYQNVKLQDIIK
ncbi:MAG: BNR-repeat neuraminidase N-terminal domain-containing protein [Marinifilaceae bacterium]